eukprot:TRINITY_DN3849_c0_g1_i1.p1 TRINITY_DN3849_c0_g1~~TRINITY_DN3849_c0_g1_i1.p1  ORF type:complete len:196 (+),score=14.82 TRINITY_DN3849_c0_g1_i1:44-631(+)
MEDIPGTCAFLDKHNIQYEITMHPPAFTSEEHKKFLNGEYEGHEGPGFLQTFCDKYHTSPSKLCLVKNMFLKDKRKGDLYLVSYNTETKVEMKTLSKVPGFTASGGNVRFADEDVLFEHLRVKKGSVSPLALVNNSQKNIKFIMDTSLVDSDFVLVHPMLNTATMFIQQKDFLKFLDIVIGSKYQTFDFSSAEVK